MRALKDMSGEPTSRCHVDSQEDAARYFDRKEIALKLKGELPAHSANIHIKVLVLRDDYSRDTVTGKAVAQQDQS